MRELERLSLPYESQDTMIVSHTSCYYDENRTLRSWKEFCITKIQIPKINRIISIKMKFFRVHSKMTSPKNQLFSSPYHLSLFLRSISNPLLPFSPTKKRVFPDESSISCMFITLYPLRDLRNRSVKWKNNWFVLHGKHTERCMSPWVISLPLHPLCYFLPTFLVTLSLDPMATSFLNVYHGPARITTVTDQNSWKLFLVLWLTNILALVIKSYFKSVYVC